MTRTDALNKVIKDKGYSKYLEIGLQKSINFDYIECEIKHSVDNKEKAATYNTTSNEFFASNKEKYDLIFIDGDHSFEQSLADFNNAIEHLSEGGCVAMHDVLPKNKLYTQPEWCGSVWKTALCVSSNNTITTFAEDHGVMFVWTQNKSYEDINSSALYPGVEFLKKELNVVSIDSLSSVKAYMSTSHPVSPYFSDVSDDKLKSIHKELFGYKPRGRWDRTRVINKITDHES